MIIKFKNILKKKLNVHRKKNFFYLIATVHFIKYLFYKSFRKDRCLIDPSPNFFYKYKNLAKFFSIPLVIFGKYLKKKNILISVNNNCNFSIGHIYAEIDQLKRMQKLNYKYLDSEIWFLTSRKEILMDTHYIFETKNFKVLFGGLKQIFLTFVAIKNPNISIDASLGPENYIFGSRPHSYRIVHNSKEKQRARLTFKSSEFHPIKNKLNYYKNEKDKLFNQLNITKKYIVIQIKTVKDNATIEPINPETYLGAIKYFQKKGLDIIFAGREKCPKIFINNNVIDYANSVYISSLNDYLLIGNCSLVLSSASGFLLLAESLDKPILTINSTHIMGPYGRRSIVLPTIIAKGDKIFSAIEQHKYLCTYGPECGFTIFNDMHIHHMPTEEEILEGAKELESMLEVTVPDFTPLQKKIRENGVCPKLANGVSRISDYYIKKHEYFFRK